MFGGDWHGNDVTVYGVKKCSASHETCEMHSLGRRKASAKGIIIDIMFTLHWGKTN